MHERALVTCRGRVEHGRHLGRSLGAPTANLALGRDARVPFGTFAAHVGVRPSVEADGQPLLEVHLLDFEGDLYGRDVIVTLAYKVADEVQLESLEALARKIADDVAAVRSYFAQVAG
jgi:riboflavin kinase/FMN adenylyltransferase